MSRTCEKCAKPKSIQREHGARGAHGNDNFDYAMKRLSSSYPKSSVNSWNILGINWMCFSIVFDCTLMRTSI